MIGNRAEIGSVDFAENPQLNTMFGSPVVVDMKTISIIVNPVVNLGGWKGQMHDLVYI